MSLFDWLEMGNNKVADTLNEYIPGAIQINLGDQLEGYIVGGQEISIFGRYCQLTVDAASYFKALFPVGGITGVGGSIVSGSTGYTNFVYGQNVGTIYGQNVDIKRAVKAEVSGENFLFEYLGNKTGSIGAGLFKPPEMSGSLNAVGQVDTDKAVSVITTILAALQSLSALAFNLVLYLKYPAPNPADYEENQLQALEKEMEYIAKNPLPPGTSVEQLEADAIGGAAPGPSATTTLFKNLSWTIPNRLGALINEFEMVGSAAREANQNLVVALKLKAFKDLIAGWVTRAVTNAQALGRAILDGLKDAAAKVRAAIIEYKWVIVALIAVLVVCAGIVLLALGTEGKL